MVTKYNVKLFLPKPSIEASNNLVPLLYSVTVPHPGRIYGMGEYHVFLNLPHFQTSFSLTKTKWHTFANYGKDVVYDPRAK